MNDYTDELLAMTVEEWNKNSELMVKRQVTLTSGVRMSIQASVAHYCTPRSNTGPYTTVEVGFPTAVFPSLLEYADEPDRPTETVYGYVPVEIVKQIIKQEGGILKGEVPPFKKSDENDKEV